MKFMEAMKPFFETGEGETMRNVRVVIWGLGAMGRGMARLLLEKTGVEIVGVCDRDPGLAGKPLFEFLKIDPAGHPEVVIRDDIHQVLSPRCCDVVLLATDSFLESAFDKIALCLEHQLNVISTAEEMAYPKAASPELADRLDRLARDRRVTCLGTGINPGFVLDTLILALTGTCASVRKIEARRVNDLSPFGRTVMEEQGVGLSGEEYRQRLSQGRLAGHVGFLQSMAMIADGLGVPIDRVEQTREPIVSKTTRQTPYAHVDPGQLAGIRQRGFGYVGDRLFVEMDHPQQILPHLEQVSTGDFITITGDPSINLAIVPEIPGGLGTIAMTVNMIPHVINARPGLKTMLDLPVPRAILGDMGRLIDWEEA